MKKTEFDAEVKKVNDKITSSSSKVLSYDHKLLQRENKINTLERVASCFRGKNYFGDDGMQNYLVFQLMYKYFKRVINSTNNNVYVHYWQSKELSDGKVIAPLRWKGHCF